MKTKKQTETNENQSIITNSLSGNKVYICSNHPDRFKSVNIENYKRILIISKHYFLNKLFSYYYFRSTDFFQQSELISATDFRGNESNQYKILS